MNSLKNKIISGVIWQYLQKFGTQVIQLAVSIILARILLPKDFGVIALIGVFVSVANVIIDSGFSNALIQKRIVTQKDYSTVFFLNLFISIVLYILLFLISPLIAAYYEEPLLKPIIKVIALSVIVNGFGIIQTVVLVRDLDFKKVFFVSFISVVISGVIGILLALNNFGVWSLVFYQLSAQIISVFGYWIVVGWRPHLVFEWVRVRNLFAFAFKIFTGSIIGVLYNNVLNLVIGKQYNTSILGYYNRGMLIPTLFVDTAANSLNSVMFPALSSIQDDPKSVKQIVRKMHKISSFIIFIILAILVVQARPIIEILLTDKWLPSVPFLQLVCLTVGFYPAYLINISVLTSQGRSDLYLKATVRSKSISLILIIICIPLGIYIMIIAGIIGAFISVIFAAQWSKSIIDYSMKDQFFDALPFLILSLVSGFVAWIFSVLGFNNWMTLIFGSTLGVVSYLSLSFLFKLETPKYLLKEITTYISKSRE